MELTFEKTTHIGLGYATQADAFQAGREAAQMAKGQVPSNRNDLVMVFGPGGVHFRDFIEGVRLVTGEQNLIGIPTHWVISNDLPSLDACVVLIWQVPSVQLTITSSGEKNQSLEACVTSLITQSRQKRGNNKKYFDYHGFLVIENRPANEHFALTHHMAADAGLESWLVGISPSASTDNPIIYRHQPMSSGLIGLECLSNTPWGVGSVSIGAFLNQPEVYREAVRSSLRDAQIQLQGQKPAMGLLMFDFPVEKMSRDDLWDIFRCTRSVIHDVPLIAIPTQRQFSRCSNRSLSDQNGSVISLVVPT